MRGQILKKTKRLLAVMLSLCIVFSLLLGTNGITAYAEEDTRFGFHIQSASDTVTGGTVEYKLGDAEEWTAVNLADADAGGNCWIGGTITVSTSIQIKVTLDEGYEISQASAGVQSSEADLDEAALTALTGAEGYTYAISDAGSHVIAIHFQGKNSGNPVQPGPSNTGHVSFTCQNNAVTGGSIYYKLGDAAEFTKVNEDTETNQYDAADVSTASKITIKFVPNSGYQLDTTRGVKERVEGNEKYNATSDDLAGFIGESGKELDLTSLLVGDNTVADTAFELEFGFGSSGGDDPGPDPGPGGGSSVSDDFSVTIGETTVYRAVVGEGEQNITVPENALYDVEEIDGGIAIKPKQGTDDSENSDADNLTRSLTLDPISVTGNGRVEVHAGLNYTPEGTTDGSHIEEDVPVVIKSSAEGYSFEADGDVDFLICWGNFRSTATLEGGVKARGFTLNDMAKLTIGSADSPVKEAFCAPLRDSSQMYESSSVEFNLAEVEIYADKGFTNYNELRAWDEANVNVTLSGENAKMFDNVNTMQVQTGGKFTLKSSSVIEYPQGFKAQAGYYNEIGEILDIQNDGRYQDAVKYVDCEVGDYSKKTGRYSYSINEGRTEITLASTVKALWSLGYSFRADSGDQYVEHGHFEINAGSGLCREGMTDGGEYWFEEGTEVTFKLVPDTGYQYKEGTFKFNGDGSEKVVQATDEPGVYIFTMPSNQIHVSCVFEEVEDAIDVEASAKVAGADIVVPEGAICGTAEFSVKDTTLTPEQNTAFESVAGDKTLGATLDLSMNEVINKIGTEGAWVTPVHDLKTAMDVSLKLDDSLAGQSEYVVIREHNGETEELETKYDVTTNSVSFATDGYSTYAVAYKKPATPEPPAHVHAGTKVAAVAATCTAAGNSEYYTCTCGKYFSDAACTKEIVKDSWVIAATGHKGTKVAAVAATCVTAGNSEYYTCSCGKYFSDAACTKETAKDSWVITATGHKWDQGTVTKEATTTETGIKTYHCTNPNCNETKTEELPKLELTVPEKGETVKDDSGKKYEVNNTDSEKPTVTFTGSSDKKAKTVTVPATIEVDGVTYKVTKIAPKAFKNNKTVTTVKVGSNITEIGANAFNGCTKLKTVTVGKNVTNIGSNAFKGCKVLTKVTLPSKVTTIGSNAFDGCSKLATVTIGSSVTTIGAGAFKNCKALTKITLPSKTTKIGANAFNGCSKLKTITIKSTKMTSKTIAKDAFKGVSSKVTIQVPKGKAKTYKTLFQKKGLSKKVTVK